jgi:predicted Ser/Thr protein kinase/WD40 repeat protein
MDSAPNDIALLRMIDGLADRFEAEWRADRTPQIEDFLAQASADVRPHLLRELLAIELEWRSRRGLAIDAADYEHRFSEAREIVAAALAESAGADDEYATQEFAPAEGASERLIGSTLHFSRTGDSSTPDEGRKRPQSPANSEIPKRIGRYRILRLLGAGAMGAVYLAHDEQLHRQVALKVPKREFERQGSHAARFLREARTAATLNHPHICTVYDIGEEDGVRYITMAYIEGRSLQEIVHRSGPQPQRTAALLVRKLALALQTAHEAGVVHRDLKLANVMLDVKRQPVIMDFGLALLVDREGDARLTHDGTIIGSPAYMSPEQAGGDPNAVGPPSDIYSLGVILYELLTGRLPYQGGVMAVLSQIRSDDPPPIRSLRTDVDPDLEAIATRMMAKSLEDRYASMQEAAEDLTRWLKGTPVKHAPFEDPLAAISRLGTSRRTRCAPQPFWRNRALWITAALLPILVLATVIILRTNAGDVRIEVDDERIAVELDGDRITLTDLSWTGRKRPGKHRLAVLVNGARVPLGETLPISLDGREHQLVATLGDVRLSGNEFQVERGKAAAVRISLIPQAGKSPAERSAAKAEPSPPPTHLRQRWKKQLAGEANSRLWFLDFPADSSSLLAVHGSSWGVPEQFSIRDAQPLRRFPFWAGPSTALSSGRPLLAAAVGKLGGGFQTEVWDLENGAGTQLAPSGVEDAQGAVRRLLAISPDGNLCALGNERAAASATNPPPRHVDLVVWDIPANKILWEKSLPQGSNLSYLRFSHDGRRLLVANSRQNENGAAYGPVLYDARTGQAEHHFGQYTRGYSYDGEFLPDDSAVVVAAFNGTFIAIDVADPSRRRVFSWLRPEDGELYKTGTMTGGVPWMMPREELLVREIEVAPDGRSIWSARADGIVAVWDVQGARLREFEAMYPSPRNATDKHYGGLELSPDGKLLAISDAQGSVTLFEVAGEEAPPAQIAAADEAGSSDDSAGATVDFRDFVEPAAALEDNFHGDLVLAETDEVRRAVENGAYVLEHKVEKSVTTSIDTRHSEFDQGLIEVDVRSVGRVGSWRIGLRNSAIKTSFFVWIEHGAVQISFGGPDHPGKRQTLTASAPLREDGGFDRVQLYIRERRMELAINGRRIGDALELPFNVAPGELALGAALDRSDSRAKIEYDRVAYFPLIGLKPPSSEPAVPLERIAAAGETVDLMTVAPLDLMYRLGPWENTEHGFHCGAVPTGLRRLELPIRPLGEYDLEVEFTSGSEPSFTMRLPLGETGASADFTVAAFGGQAMGIIIRNLVATQLPEPMGRQPSPINAGRRHTVTAQVRRTENGWRIIGLVDGQEQVRWEGEPAELSLHLAWRTPDMQRPLVGQWITKDATLTVHAARLKVISGEAHRMPTPSAQSPNAARTSGASARPQSAPAPRFESAPTASDDYTADRILIEDDDTQLMTEGGRLVIVRKTPHPGGGWWGFRRIDYAEGVITADVRVVGDRGGWLIDLQSAANGHGFRIMRRGGELSIGPSIFDSQPPNNLERVISNETPPSAPGEFDEIQLLVRKRSVRISLNGKQLGPPVELPDDLPPGILRAGLLGSEHGDVRVEFDRLEFRRLIGGE